MMCFEALPATADTGISVEVRPARQFHPGHAHGPQNDPQPLHKSEADNAKSNAIDGQLGVS